MMRTVRGLGWLLPALLVACATDHPKSAASATKVTPQLRSGSTELRAYQLLDWIAPDDRTLIVNSVDRSLFKAQFRHQCNGMRLVDTLAFIVPTPPQVEKYEGVVLPDGTRCVFTSITRLQTAPPSHSKDATATDNP
jgi:hypothetical protein